MSIVSFLRNLDRRRVVYIMRRLLSLALPMRPYMACGTAPRCPCLAAQQTHITGVAMGDAIRMKIKA
ncbi:hypothetical protein AB840_10515 [Megasphaera cerevisiae DSM 20462]|jgi:hypothetical protein|uniref:Uncharacterized protein n=1 Tax=Megasphaera cerevisiae DSM 20462 TaxID=1122219 RepID=A0A0J6WUV2_9FIRM|nr:hypothetical protein [Megasphaera cerevisiae]KMO85963.1 hypothetical protein AB840_10515 [Megasphaera cerevisiae DSM 20462]MCI1749760.1 hypothetical protein [Megasphaera cerevisiae]OKY52449.1 hypothetical protein BSR42_12765 [Megasphaera cerevisiae]SKA26596.1 hypothetical protein SAMN05660900_03093 [Megasphaera cerevisiae DSM 20462]